MKPADVVYILIHSREPEIRPGMGPEVAHAFGPFAGPVELAAWEASLPPGDTCYKIVMAMVVPDDATVITIDASDRVEA